MSLGGSKAKRERRKELGLLPVAGGPAPSQKPNKPDNLPTVANDPIGDPPDGLGAMEKAKWKRERRKELGLLPGAGTTTSSHVANKSETTAAAPKPPQTADIGEPPPGLTGIEKAKWKRERRKEMAAAQEAAPAVAVPPPEPQPEPDSEPEAPLEPHPQEETLTLEEQQMMDDI